MKFKGHIKLTLMDAKTGKVKKVVEGDNVITNAVKDIFQHDVMGCVDYTKLYGSDGIWKNWFGGIVCYNQQHANLNTDDYFMPDATDNPVVAHAGQTPIDPDHDDDLTRGNPVGSSYIETDNSHKIVFEWGPTQGNGIIRALSLTHSDVGSYGNGVESYHFENSFEPFEDLKNSSLTNIYTNPVSKNNIFTMYDDYHGLSFVIGDDGEYDGDTRANTDLQTNSLTVYIRRLPYFKIGLFETVNPRTGFDRVFTVSDIPFVLYSMPSFCFDQENKYLYIFNNITGINYDSYNLTYVTSSYSNNSVDYAIIDCNEYENEPQTRIVDSGTLYSSEQDLAPTGVAKWRGVGYTEDMFEGDSFYGIVVDGDYAYIPTTSGMNYGSWLFNPTWNHNGYRKIKISTGADSGLIEFNDSFGYMMSPVVAGGLIIRSGCVSNGGVGYSCVKTFEEAEQRNWYFQEINKTITAAFPRCWSGLTFDQTGGNASKPRYILANKLLNTSKINLSQAVEKTPSQNMRIEYTITEEEINNGG